MPRTKPPMTARSIGVARPTTTPGSDDAFLRALELVAREHDMTLLQLIEMLGERLRDAGSSALLGTHVQTSRTRH